MNERIEEQPFDDRHNTPPVNYRDDPFVMTGSQVHPGGYVGTEIPSGLGEATYTKLPEPELSHGLTWTFMPGHKLMDLGRITPDTIEALHTLDLRVILAHLDSAAQTVKGELDRRY